ncbi:MAG: PD-(D/E)XK nuclease family protein, partial [Spirochaetaceae bacterium]|nr:PD-(D/E)XK nuclease family protein [Spirochaetaceae bacterium]
HLLFAVEKNGALCGVLSEALGASTSRVFENLDAVVYTSVVKKTLIYPQKEAVHAALLALVTETARAFNGSAVFLVEERLRVPLDGLQIEGAADAAYLDGAPDLVLEDEDGNFSIVDFKSAALPPKPDCLARDADGRALGDFQMPAYYTLLKAGMGKSAARGFFASVKDAKIAPYFAPQKTGRTETARFEDVLEPFRRQTAKYIQSVCTHDFDIYINTIHSVCADCEYTRVCRRSRAAPRPAPAFFGEETA